MNKTNLCDVPAASLPEDLLAYAAGYLQLVVGHHDSLATRIAECNAPNFARVAEVGKFQRQLQIQAAIVESAMQAVAEMESCDKAHGRPADRASIDAHRLQLLEEIRSLADLSVSA